MNPSPELLIAGAGPAGIAAALVGARRGLTTLLVDRAPEPGGAVVSAMHSMLCGLYSEAFPRKAGDTLNGGIQAEIAEALNRETPSVSQPLRRGRTVVLPFDPRAFKNIVSEILSIESNLQVQLGTAVTDVSTTAGRINTVLLSNGTVLRPDLIFDCTGNASVARLAGAPMQTDEASAPQLAGFGIRIDGIKGDMSMLPVAVPFELRKAAEQDLLPETACFSVFTPAIRPRQGCLKLALTAEKLSSGKQELNSYAAEVLKQLQKRLSPQFSEASIAECSSAPQPRIGEHLLGRKTVTSEDVLGARKHDREDAVRNAWPMEIWNLQTGPEYHYVPDGDWYDIPASCLVTPHISNLACAGRCISATARAAASVRVAGTCFALGELAVKNLT